MSLPPLPAPGKRIYGLLNLHGTLTLYRKEVWRFLKIWMQTLLAPLTSTLLFILVFSVAVGNFRPTVENVPFVAYIAPGLIMLAVMQNAFANTSSSLLLIKIQGSISDFLLPPLVPYEHMLAMAAAGVTRGFVVGFICWIATLFFLPLFPQNFPLAVFYLFTSSLMMAVFGIIVGLWAHKFDHLATVTNFILTPLLFLSGTFYPASSMPEPFATFSYYNPFYYAIDGFRHSVVGTPKENGEILTGILVLIGLCFAICLICQTLLKRGWRITT